MSTQDIKDLSATMQQLQQQWGEVLPKLEEVRTEKVCLEMRVNTLAQENATLTRANEALSGSLATVTREKADLETRVNDLMQEKAKLERKVAAAQEEQKQLAQLRSLLSTIVKPVSHSSSSADIAEDVVAVDVMAPAVPEPKAPSNNVEPSKRAKTPESQRTELDHFTKRIERYTAKLSKKPNNPEFLFELAYSQYKVKDYKSASTNFHLAEKHGYDKTNWMLWYYQAQTYLGLNNSFKAHECVDKAITCASKGENHYLKAQIYISEDKLIEARIHADIAKQSGINIDQLNAQLNKAAK